LLKIRELIRTTEQRLWAPSARGLRRWAFKGQLEGARCLAEISAGGVCGAGSYGRFARPRDYPGEPRTVTRQPSTSAVSGYWSRSDLESGLYGACSRFKGHLVFTIDQPWLANDFSGWIPARPRLVAADAPTPRRRYGGGSCWLRSVVGTLFIPYGMAFACWWCPAR